MKMIEATLDNVSEIVPEALASGEDCAVYCVADEHCAVVGSNGGADLDMIDRLGIRLVQIKHEGGTIVLSPGDVDVGIFTRDYSGDIYREQIVEGLTKLLREHCSDVKVSGNDILAEGKKVCGFGSRMFGETLYTAIHISVGVNISLIRQICTKQMVKVPTGLNNYGITTTDIMSVILSALGKKLEQGGGAGE